MNEYRGWLHWAGLYANGWHPAFTTSPGSVVWLHVADPALRKYGEWVWVGRD